MFSARVDVSATVTRIGALPARLRVRLQKAVESGAGRLLAIVQAKLSGEVLKARSGALRSSIRAEISEDGSAIVARVLSDGSVPYARIQEYGGRVFIPGIVPVNARALAFTYRGRLVFAERAAAHAVDIPERSYLRTSLAEFEPALLDDIRKLTAESL